MTTPEEAAHRVFDKFDNKRSNTIGCDKVNVMLEETYKELNYCTTDQKVNDTLEYMKISKDGEISREEFVLMIKEYFEATKLVR